ncbi:MAG TPA: phosphatase PAP2 family protein, partial [Rhodospirillales bacterium]|nr:phosphatase PAP2 family protein [Rhodospirillales bacterium]
MIGQLINTLTSFIAAHPHWVGLTVFAATALESMAFVGSIFPGMSMVIALSGLAASLGANVWVLVLWCALGAVLGDGVSFWIGHHYGDRLKSIWPFRGRPELLETGIAFFQRQGGKSIVVGRFLPFTRAVVPIAAGMLGMSPVRFYIANVLSAIGWAVMSVLPAAGIGLAFTVINESSSRVALMLGLFIAVFLAALVITRVTARFLLPWFNTLFAGVHEFIEARSRRAGRIAAFVFGLRRRSASASTAWIFLTLVLMIAFLEILENIIPGAPLVRADMAVNSLVQGLRTPLGDAIMIAVTSMADATVVFWASAVLLGGLLALRAWRTFGLAFLSLAGVSLFVPLLKWTLHRPRPIDIYSAVNAFSFPSGHAAFAALLGGLIAVIGTRGLSRNVRTSVWALVLTLSTLVGFSRVYLSAHWPSDVIGGLLFGWAMAGIFGLFEERIREPSIRPGLLGLASAAALFVAWGVHGTATFDDAMARYKPRQQDVRLAMENWLGGGWKDVPSARIDLKGEFEEPLFFQAAAPLAEIKNALQASGWSPAPAMGWGKMTQFIGAKKKLSGLLPLPLLHNGKLPLLTMTRRTGLPGQRNVIRLWDAGIRIDDIAGRSMVLVGS